MKAYAAIFLMAAVAATVAQAENVCGFTSAGIGASCSDCATACSVSTTTCNFLICTSGFVSQIIFNNYGLTALPDAFNGLYSLATLKAAVNQLSSLPTTLFARYGLRFLDLSNNSFTSMPRITFLHQLLLDYNALTALPDDIGTFSLVELRVTGNKIQHLPESLGSLSLTYLGASHNPLLDLPNSFGQLNKIKALALDYTDLTALPASMANMQALTWLSLNQANFQTFPEPILSLTNLTYIDLGGSNITSIPYGIGSLTHLSTLFFGANALTAVPDSLFRLPLKTLYLARNSITVLPDLFANLTNLRMLVLSYNNLQELPPSIATLTQLTRLDLAGNYLRCDEVAGLHPLINTSCVQSEQKERPLVSSSGSVTSTKLFILLTNATRKDVEDNKQKIEDEIEEAMGLEDGAVQIVEVTEVDGQVVVEVVITAEDSASIVANLIVLVKDESSKLQGEYLRKAVDAYLRRADDHSHDASSNGLSAGARSAVAIIPSLLSVIALLVIAQENRVRD